MDLRAFRESVQLLRTRRFGIFCAASLLSNIGTFAQQVAQPWLLLTLGASSFVVGLDAFAQGAPVWLLTLVGGMLADHADRRRVIATFQSIQMLCPALLVVLLLTHSVRPWMIVMLSLVVGVTDALSMPSFQSIVPSIVARDQIAAGLALNATQFNLSRILGPAVAGGLMVALGAVGCFAVNALSYLPFIVVALWILPHAVGAAGARAAIGPGQILRGIRAVAREPTLRGALLTVFTTSLLCGPLITFTPILVRQVFHSDATHFSLAVAAFGVGGLCGAVGLLFIDSQADRRRLCSGWGAGFGVALVLVAFNPAFPGLIALLVLAGLCMSMSNTSANTIAQGRAPVALRGQSVSLYMLAIRGGTSLGCLITGITVHEWGVREALCVNGVLAVAAHWAIGRAWRRGPQSAMPPP